MFGWWACPGQDFSALGEMQNVQPLIPPLLDPLLSAVLVLSEVKVLFACLSHFRR